MSFQSSRLHSKREAAGVTAVLLLPPLLLALVVIFAGPASSLSQDGVLLLKFKYSVLSDPLAALGDWNYDDATPCAWNGVVCTGFPEAATLNWTIAGSGTDGTVQSSVTTSRVISLVLPNSQLLGSIPPELGLVEHLRHLDLSGNVLNGTLPASLFNSSELRVLSLASNEISGELPELDGRMNGLQSLNLSNNTLTGRVPSNLMLLPNLTVVSLAGNYLSGELPGGSFELLEYLDLSSNLVNGSLPLDLAGQSLQYLNLSYNRISGKIPLELGTGIPVNATVDFSFNNLDGEIPKIGALAVQSPAAFAGNPDLCGKPLRNLCTIPSSLSDPPNSSTTTQPTTKSPPAFAAIPKDADASSTNGGQNSSGRSGLRPAVVIAITVGDVAGIAVLLMVFLYVYQVMKKKKREKQQQQQERQVHQNHFKNETGSIGLNRALPPPISPESKGAMGALSCCLRKKAGDGDDTEDTSASSETDTEGGGRVGFMQGEGGKPGAQQKQQQGAATLVTVDGDSELEMETLLKASAYILGASGSSIVYKAVLVDGTALAVRRIGESSILNKLKDFDAQVRVIAKFRHPNLLRLRGFYWGPDEKLVIHDYASNGSLANLSFTKKLGSSPFHLTWDARLRIARGVARALAYLHDKKSIHGNVKPSNILLDADMEPKIGDFGLERLMSVDGSHKLGTSARQFGSKRSVQSSNSLPDLSPIAGASPCGSASTSAAAAAPPPYLAPECLKNLKPNAKWDVYAFGMVLLELLAGKVLSEVELCQWNAGFLAEERNRVLRMADPAMRGEVEGKEDALLSCFKLGFACCATAPQKRPPMKDAVQVLDKLPSSSCSCSTASTY